MSCLPALRGAALALMFVVLLAAAGCDSSDSTASQAPATESAEATDPSADDTTTDDVSVDDDPVVEEGAPDEAAVEETPDESDPAYQLAVIDGNVSPSADDVAVYAKAIKRLQKKCKNTRTQLADYSVTTQQLLEKNGSEETSLIEILTGIEDSIPRGYPHRDCKDLFAAFVTLMRPE